MTTVLRFVSRVALLYVLLFGGVILAHGIGERLPDSTIAFTTGRNANFDIYLLETGRNLLVNVSRHPSWDTAPAWSPDGMQLVFVSNRSNNNNLFIMDFDGRNVRQITDGQYYDFPTWSPDGTTIAYQQFTGADSDIFVIPVTGGDSIRLTRQADNLTPGWTPDGAVIYGANQVNVSSIRIVTLSGEMVIYEEGALANFSFPRYSPDGTRLAYVAQAGSGFLEVYIRNTSTGSTQQVTAFRNTLGPTWSPDGCAIAVSGIHGDNVEIFIVPIDGSLPRRVTNDPAQDFAPAWRPLP